MRYYSTNNKRAFVDFKTAVLASLPPDNGLYMPESIHLLEEGFIRNLAQYGIADIAYHVLSPYLAESFDSGEIRDIVDQSFTFPAPLVSLDDKIHVLELWHGPSLAFKDFGARFMAQVMSRIAVERDLELTVLVATSGDTGGAVAAGFYQVPNINVVILYPKGKVSPLQERQLTTMGKNIYALCVDGTFDDCQSMVKTAFLDNEIKKHIHLTSANSINISRLLPQTIYYFEAYKQLPSLGGNIVCVVPSGNFGNLTAGLMAKKMGLPIAYFLAATNANSVFTDYLSTGIFTPRTSVQTISNAMDVGNPSNFVRIIDLYNGSLDEIKQDIVSASVSDQKTKEGINNLYGKYKYTMDPHGAVGYKAVCDTSPYAAETNYILLETAHPAKFLPVMEATLGNIEIPVALSSLTSKPITKTDISSSYRHLNAWLHDVLV